MKILYWVFTIMMVMGLVGIIGAVCTTIYVTRFGSYVDQEIVKTSHGQMVITHAWHKGHIIESSWTRIESDSTAEVQFKRLTGILEKVKRNENFIKSNGGI